MSLCLGAFVFIIWSAAVACAEESYVYPEKWYDGSGDWSPAIQAAINSNPSAMGIKVKLTGPYVCKTQINVNRGGVYLVGDGTSKTRITFAPTQAQTLFQVRAGNSMLVHGGMKDFSITGTTAFTKTHINLVDVDIYEINNVEVYDDTGNNDIGLLAQGRDHLRVEKFTGIADRPIVISANPNIGGGLDGCVFRDIYLICNKSTGKNVEITDGATLSNVYFEPPFHCNKGAYGIYWNDTTTTLVSLNVGFRGIRCEQPTDYGYGFYINHAYGIANLQLDGLYCGMAHGYYLYKVQGNMKQCTYLGILPGSGGAKRYSGVALNLDSLYGDWMQTMFGNGNGTINIGSGAVKEFGLTRLYGSQAYSTRDLEIYTPPAEVDYRAVITQRGVRRWAWRGTLSTGGGTASLPPLKMGEINSVIITVSGRNTDHSSGGIEGGQVIAGVGAAAYLSQTSNFSMADNAGKLCLLTKTTPISLKNNLAYAVDIVLTAEWVDGTVD